METVEQHGTISTYTHQCAAVDAAVQRGVEFPTGLDNALEIMDLVDECYRLAGLPLRESEPYPG